MAKKVHESQEEVGMRCEGSDPSIRKWALGMFHGQKKLCTHVLLSYKEKGLYVYLGATSNPLPQTTFYCLRFQSENVSLVRGHLTHLSTG